MRPTNILLIVTDQQRIDTVGAYGSTICRTPHMDRVAREGLRFTNAFTPTGLCSPVRCSLMTGLYPHGHKVLTNISLHPVREELDPADDRLTPVLRSAGYRLGYVGKWHVSKRPPTDFGFDDHVSLGDFETWRHALDEPVPPELHDYTRQVCARDPAPVERSRPAFLADHAIRLIDRYHGDAGAPFFVRLDFHGPHFPNVVPEPYFSMYPPATIPPWPNHADPLTGKPAVQRIKQRHWKTEGMSWQQWQPLVSAYLGEISLIDAQVGRVLDRLDALGIAEDTLVIWTTDHGDTIGAHGICNKDYTMYEEIYHVPLLVRWPAVVGAGRVSDAWTHHFIDLFATLVELAGGRLPEPCHGRSLVPILEGAPPPADWPEDAYCEFHGSHMGLYSMRLLTDEHYAYVYHSNDIDELYDRRADPWQLENLAERPGPHAAALAARRRRMVEWMAATDDHLHNEWTVDWLTNDPVLAAQAPGRRRTKW